MDPISELSALVCSAGASRPTGRQWVSRRKKELHSPASSGTGSGPPVFPHRSDGTGVTLVGFELERLLNKQSFKKRVMCRANAGAMQGWLQTCWWMEHRQQWRFFFVWWAKDRHKGLASVPRCCVIPKWSDCNERGCPLSGWPQQCDRRPPGHPPL